MELISWNFRGAGSPDTIRTIVRMVRDHMPNVLFLMETRVSSAQAQQIIRKSHFTHLAVVDSRGFAGGLWCLWDQKSISLSILSYTSQLINFAILKNGRIPV